jgi:glycosyltransferase involved in cell wall biosynthesis
MRTLHVSAYFAPAFRYGGPPRSILGLCRALRRLGVDAEVLATTADGQDELPAGRRDYDGVPAEYLARSTPKRFFNAAGLRQRLDELAPTFDLLHVHGLWNMTVWKACAAARRRKKPYLISPRGMLDPGSMRRRASLKRFIYPLVERPNLATAAMLHATSQAEADAIRRFDLPTPIRIVPNGVDLLEPDHEAGRALRRRCGIAESNPVVLYLGRVAPLKRLDLLAAAFHLVREKAPDAKLLIVGPDEGGHLASLRPLFEPFGSAVHFFGEVNADGKAALFAAATVSVCCSDSESFGLSIAEGLGAGVPAVVTQTCPWQSLAQVEAGRWVEQTPPAIAGGILDVIADPAGATQMGERGRRLVQERYSWEGVGRRMVELYQESLAASTSK